MFQIIFALSNPTSKSECSAEEAYKWSKNKAVFASGSPFPKYEQDGVVFEPGQVNIFNSIETFNFRYFGVCSALWPVSWPRMQFSIFSLIKPFTYFREITPTFSLL